ncbi:MAG: DUF2911 domain-containing protein [Chitinophagaceae bacterium]
MQIRIRISIAALLFTLMTHAQMQPTELDKSPMDMSYSPNAYPIMKFQGKAVGSPNARIVYSRPQKRGRIIFGGEVKYDEVWRLGANENTEIEFFKDASLDGKKIAKGRYTLFCIPTVDNWTIIINKDTDNWGNFNYDNKKDIFRFTVPVQKTDPIENFTMYFDTNNNLLILWDDVKVSIATSFVADKVLPAAKPKGR